MYICISIIHWNAHTGTPYSLTISLPRAWYASTLVMQRWQVVPEQLLQKDAAGQLKKSPSDIVTLGLRCVARINTSPIIIHITNQHRREALFCTMCTPSNRLSTIMVASTVLKLESSQCVSIFS